MSAIVEIVGREILDSRGNPTVEVEVLLEDGSEGRAAVPSGASTGAHEAVELRDGDKALWRQGRAEGRRRRQWRDLRGAGRRRRHRADPDRPHHDRPRRHAQQGRLGANAILGVSLACAKAAAMQPGLPLYRYVGGVAARTLPVPMMNIINGGAHADNPIDIQEFMIMPVGADTVADAVRMGAEIFHTSRRSCRRPATTPMSATRAASRPTSPAPRRARLHHEAGREGRLQARRRRLAGARRRLDRVLRDGLYDLAGRGQEAERPGDGDYLAGLCDAYPILSIEDGMAEDDWDGWVALTERIGDKVPAGRRRSVRHQLRAAQRRASRRARPTRSS
jgi:enolase